MKRSLARLYKGLRGVPLVLSYRPDGSMPPSVRGEIRIDLHENLYSRYLYSFLKFFDLEGYRVTLRARPGTIYSISKAQYGSRLLDEGLLRLAFDGAEPPLLGDRAGQKRLEPFDFRPATSDEIYDVPMALHPMMYSSGCWDDPVRSGPESRPAVLFVGNPDSEVYAKLGGDGVFPVIDRVSLWQRLAARPDTELVRAEGEARASQAGVVLMDSRSAGVAVEDFRGFLAGFRYFLCAPGVFMPLCHNLIEALSVGTVPVIQRSYARLLEPALEDGVNAVIFDDEDGLDAAIERCQALPPSEHERLSRNALDYYDEHLTPAAVTGRVLDPSVRTVRLLAGRHSVELLRKQLATS